jgi:RNA polymerase sigma factor (sigma-70 family)
VSPVCENALVVAAAHGDNRAREQLLDNLAPLISGMARRYQHLPGLERDELLQEGAVGVLRAVERYDAGLGTPFWAYASWWVRQAMQRLASQLTRPVVLSDRAMRQLARLHAARRDYAQVHGRDPCTEQLATMTRLSVDQIASLTLAARVPRGFDEPRPGDDEGSTLAEHLGDPRAHEAYDRVLERMTINGLHGLGAALNARERHVLCARFGIGQPALKLREVGQTLGVSAERVRQIEAQALTKLREAVAQRQS